MSDKRLNPGAVRQLLYRLCVELGFCLPPDEAEKLVLHPPADVDQFVEAVFTAEGMDAKFRGPIYRQVKDRAAKLFGPPAPHN